MAGTLEYWHNNSGGYDWLKASDIDLLEDNGWVQSGYRTWAKHGESEEALLTEWKNLTWQDPDAQGCNCCGPPHNFTWVEDEVEHPAVDEWREALYNAALHDEDEVDAALASEPFGVTFVIDLEVGDAETAQDIRTALESILPYMADNVHITES